MAKRQRMGMSLAGCHNLNNWRHLFNPNSASALQGEIACDIYWAGRSENVETTRSGLDDDKTSGAGPAVYDANGNKMGPQFLSIGYKPQDQQNQQPDSNARKLIVAAVVVVILAYAFKNL